MRISDWRAKRHMKDPVRGMFRVTGSYDAHPNSSPPGTRIIGVIMAPGIPATPAEHKTDERGRWAGVPELPVRVDRADPSRFAILWDEVKPVSWRDQEHQAAQAEADRINSGAAPFQFGPGAGVSSTIVPIGPDGRPMSPEAAAQVQAALGQVFGQTGGSSLGQAISQAVEQAFGQATGQATGQPSSQATGQPSSQATGQPSSQATGQPSSQAPAAPHDGFNPAEAAQFLASGGGEQASATVVAAQEVAAPGGAAPGGTVDLTLEITRADGSFYTTRTRLSFSTPERRDAVATPGTRLRVRIDPNVPTRVAIDTTGMS